MNQAIFINFIKEIMQNDLLFYQYFFKIATKQQGVKNFLLNKEQKYIQDKINNIKKYKALRVIILKSRQVGITTYLVARGFNYVIKKNSFKGACVAHRESASNNIFNIMKRFWEFLPNYIKPNLKVKNNKEIYYPYLDNRFNFATAGGGEIGRSDTLHFFHGSEVAFWPNLENHLAGILMAVSDDRDSELILESTAFGPYGIFYDLCMEATLNKNNFELIFIPWFWHKNYVKQIETNFEFSKEWLEYGKMHKLNDQQLMWAYDKNLILSKATKEDINKGPSMRFYQEFPATVTEAFTMKQSNTLLDYKQILSCSREKNFINTNEHLHKSKIIFGIDIARGGGDETWMIDRMDNYIGFNVNLRLNLADIMQIVGVISDYIKKFRPDKIFLDMGGNGAGVYDRLKELGYGSILYLVNFGSKPYDLRKYLNKRAEMWGNMAEFFNSNSGFIIKDDLLLKQLSSASYTFNSKGQMQILGKDEIRKKHGFSPDGGDAVALTFAMENFFMKNKFFDKNNKHQFVSNNDFNKDHFMENYDPLNF